MHAGLAGALGVLVESGGADRELHVGVLEHLVEAGPEQRAGVVAEPDLRAGLLDPLDGVGEERAHRRLEVAERLGEVGPVLVGERVHELPGRHHEGGRHTEGVAGTGELRELGAHLGDFDAGAESGEALTGELLVEVDVDVARPRAYGALVLAVVEDDVTLGAPPHHLTDVDAAVHPDPVHRVEL